MDYQKSATDLAMQRQALGTGHLQQGYQITDPQEPGLTATASQIIERIFGLESLLDSLEGQRDRLLLNMDPPKPNKLENGAMPTILQAQLALSSARLAMLEGRMRSLLVRLEHGL